MRRFWHRLWNVLRPHRADGDLERELLAHLTILQDDFERRGMTTEDARRAARMSLGGIEQTKELHRDARSFAWLNDARQDIVHGLRFLRRSPAFTLTAAASLAIGIGANTAIFSIANGLLAEAPDGVVDRLTLADVGILRGDGGLNPMPYRSYVEIRHRSTTLSAVFAQDMFPHAMGFSDGSSGAVQRIFGQYVTSNFFTVLGVRPVVGTLFDEADTNHAVVVLNYGFWARHFNKSPDVVGRLVRLNGQAFTVVGVATRGFDGTGLASSDVWLPLERQSGSRSSVLSGARLRPGISVSQACAELAAIGQTLDHEQGLPRAEQHPLHALPYSRAGANRNIVLGFAGALMTIVTLVLAISCANIAGIVLARSVARNKEMALRLALGARRGRLVRQLLTEVLIVFSLGGASGLLLAKAFVFLGPLLPVLPMPVTLPLALDMRVAVFTATLSLFAGVASGLIPAIKGSKADAVSALKEVSQSAPGGSRLRSAFVVGQIVISVFLLVVAALFVRAVRFATSTDPGFDARDIEIASVDLSMGSYDSPARGQFWRQLIERVHQLPGVEAATLARVPPGGFEGIGLGGIRALGITPPLDSFSPSWNIVDTNYFATLRIPLIDGRDFSDVDIAGDQPVAIVSQAVARRFWPHARAVGHSVTVPQLDADGRSTTRTALIIGVAADVKSTSLIDGPADPYVYLPLRQNDSSIMTMQMAILTRSAQGLRVSAQVRDLVSRLDSDLVVVRSETLQESIALGLAPQRILAMAVGTLGLVGMLLAAIGIYGVMAFTWSRRQHELGIRLALGAQRPQIVAMVLYQGLLLVGAGLAIGLPLAAAASRLLSVFLYDLPPLHVLTFVGAVTLFGLVGLAASYLAVRRVVAVDPLQTLRSA